MKEIAQFEFAPVDLVHELSQGERTQYYRYSLSEPVQHVCGPIRLLSTEGARHLM
jgi:hypothetical protein